MSLHRRRAVRWYRLLWPGILWIAALWMLLWGEVSWANLLAGLVVGTVVLTVLPMPPTLFRGTLRPVRFIVLLARFQWDLIVASIDVARLAFYLGHQPKGALIGIRLRSSNDLTMTLVAELSSLVPGTLVIDAHRLSGTLYLHVLDLESSGGAEAVRRDILALEERVLRAFMSREDLEHLGLMGPRSRRGARWVPSRPSWGADAESSDVLGRPTGRGGPAHPADDRTGRRDDEGADE